MSPNLSSGCGCYVPEHYINKQTSGMLACQEPRTKVLNPNLFKRVYFVPICTLSQVRKFFSFPLHFQPPSIVTDEVCTACDFNRPGKTCLRKLEWVWRGEIFMAKRRFGIYSHFSSPLLNALGVYVSTNGKSVMGSYHAISVTITI